MISLPHPPDRSRPRTTPGVFAALFVLLASFGPVAHPRLAARDRRAPELTWSNDTHPPVGDVERNRERPSNPAVRPRRGAETGPWRTPTVLAALLLTLPATASPDLSTRGTDVHRSLETWRPLGFCGPRGPPST